MDISDSNVVSFIIKLWLEDSDEDERRIIWRGQITHVPSGARRYVAELQEITGFIMPYLEGMGVEAEQHIEVKERLKRWRRKLRKKI
ncbi:MAG: hypothetical protein NVSMB56_13540 [Pyrinomonadaceae bacterium]